MEQSQADVPLNAASTEGVCRGCGRTTQLYVEAWPGAVEDVDVLLGCGACGRSWWLDPSEVATYVDDLSAFATAGLSDTHE